MLAHNKAYEAAGGIPAPKHHLGCHLAARAGMHGNPRTYWCYTDESMNGRLARIAAKSHPRTCARTVFRRVAFGSEQILDPRMALLP